MGFLKPCPHQQQCRSNIRFCPERIVRPVAFDNVGFEIVGVVYGALGLPEAALYFGM